MYRADDAPGCPGIEPTWASSAKDLVVSALGPSRIWATIGRGVLNEVYWPTTGRPQIRDLGFIVASEDAWYELKRLDQYEIETPTPFAPFPVIRHWGRGFELTLEVVCDDLRDCLLIRYRLNGAGFRAYPLLAPRLGAQGRLNSAWFDRELYSQFEDSALCVAASGGFSKGSAGYVGASDGWQDFHANGRMSWTHARAAEGNVALMGELAQSEGVLALAFAADVVGARTLALSALSDGFDAIRERSLQGWRKWAREMPCEASDDAILQHAHLSAAVLKMHEDRTYPGAVVASLSIPWGNSRDDLGGYHLVWPRDCVETGFAMLAIGQYEEARRMLAYLAATQRREGHWPQNFYPEGTAFWKGVQLDEAGFPILLAGKLSELHQMNGLLGASEMVRRAAGYLVRQGPVTPQDRWEESEGLSPLTLAVQIAALAAAPQFLDDPDERAFAVSFADYLNERLEDWTYVEQSELARRYDVAGHYVRINPPSVLLGRTEPILIANTRGKTYPPEEIVSLEFLGLAHLGLRPADDPKLASTWKIVDAELGADTPKGRAYYRYSHDGYGEHADGSPFNEEGQGRLWPLLTGEAGHYVLLRGEDPTPHLDAMRRLTGRCGLMPEQVWDRAAPAGATAGEPTGSAMPLLWAHSEFLKLVYARKQGLPIEQLDAVRERYLGKTPQADCWHWRPDAPFAAVPGGRKARIELPFRFRLRFGFDGWQHTAELESEPLGFGLHGVLLGADALGAGNRIDFTYWNQESQIWADVDWGFAIGP